MVKYVERLQEALTVVLGAAEMETVTQMMVYVKNVQRQEKVVVIIVCQKVGDVIAHLAHGKLAVEVLIREMV